MKKLLGCKRHRGLPFVIAISGLLFFSNANASLGGITTGGTDCSGCHGNASVQVLITGPESVAAGMTHSFTVTIIGGAASVGGFNLAADAGLLEVTQSGTAVSNGELIHTSPADFVGNTVSWDFDWVAPDVLGDVQFLAAGLSANDDGFTSGDFTGSTAFIVQVVPIPAGLLLFSSGLAIFGWFRRKPRHFQESITLDCS